MSLCKSFLNILNLAKLGQNLGCLGANFSRFEARCLRAQIRWILGAYYEVFKYFFKPELGQILGLF
jgi:hypothetical protein